MKINWILNFLAIFHATYSEYYSAVHSLEKLLGQEVFLVENLENYLKSERLRHAHLRHFLDKTEQEARKLFNNTADFYANPFNELRVINRIRRHWHDYAAKTFQLTNEVEYENRLSDYENYNQFTKPTTEDLKGAAKGISRLQNLYKLKTSDLANGTIMGKKVSLEMTPTDCYTLGWSLKQEEKYGHAVAWLLEARSRLTKQQVAGEASKGDSLRNLEHQHILEHLIPAMLESGHTKLALLLAKEQLAINPQDEMAQFNYLSVKMHLNEERINLAKGHIKATASEPETLASLYKKTCRGELRQTPREQRELRCRYVNNSAPFCNIAPFKMEELNLDPFVSVYYDVIYDSEMQYIKNVAYQKTKRSEVGEIEKEEISDIRISQQIWLRYSEHAFLQNIANRLMHITGLDIASAEPLQVVNYGIGGHYGPHYDFTEKEDFDFADESDRILTALFYINDVELGGATAFPYLKLAVPPLKGSLLVWYNYHRSLELDHRTKHASCPVIKGSKWICNEWFHNVGQEFRRPCELRPDGYKSIDYSDLNMWNWA